MDTPKIADPRMHTAEHILSGTMIRVYNCPRPFTTHLEKKKSKVDFVFSRGLTDDELHDLEERVNAVIRQDHHVYEELLDRAVAATQYDLARLPDSAGERVRIIHVGDYDACPCSGTHVRTTKEIGTLHIISASFEDGALRIRFKLSDPATTAASSRT